MYEKFIKRLTFIALKRTCNQTMAEDAVHNAFISAIRHKVKVLSMSELDFMNWMVSIVRGKCIDLMRKEKYYTDLSIDDYALSDDSTPFDEAVAQQDVYKQLKECIAGLDDTNRLILEMKYVLQISMKEIGDKLGFTPAQINSRLARARIKVKNLM
ncbi:MAG: sigma-70 family RNA polymerase sigma factor [Clostridiales bacterium]|jgi:RNA polymerase sigma-70 factor (ECF subfamily)|nr:sigma-70 family RNA polymerase sigma factor [Clostridiales bacterium]